MSRLIILSALVWSSTALSAAGQTGQPPATVEIIELTSEVFSNTRSLRILLPPGYQTEESERTYPVFYFNDGIASFHAFELDRLIPRLIRERVIPPMIVVGIDNGGSTRSSSSPVRDRADEYLPYPDVGLAHDTRDPYPSTSPAGADYPEFLVDEVIPLVESNYRTATGPDNRYLAGASYGAVSALYTTVRRPGVFGKLLLESAPVWIGETRDLLQDCLANDEWPTDIYIGFGLAEFDDAELNRIAVETQRLLVQIIRSNAPGTRLEFRLEEDASHSFEAWGERLPLALRFLFAREEPSVE